MEQLKRFIKIGTHIEEVGTYDSKGIQRSNAGGDYREKYALENGTAQLVTVNGDKCYRFTYAKENEYQDANGAIYNTNGKRGLIKAERKKVSIW